MNGPCVEISWGDGKTDWLTPDTLNPIGAVTYDNGTLNGTWWAYHAYAQEGSFKTSVTVKGSDANFSDAHSDEPGPSTCTEDVASSELAVNPQNTVEAITIELSNSVATIYTRISASGTLSGDSPPGCIIVDWGDGSQLTFVDSSNVAYDSDTNQGNWKSAWHTYTNIGNFTITALQGDEECFPVGNPGISTVSIIDPVTTINISKTDPIWAEPITSSGTFISGSIFVNCVVIDWGDGTQPTTFRGTDVSYDSRTGSGSWSGASHSFDKAEIYSILAMQGSTNIDTPFDCITFGKPGEINVDVQKHATLLDLDPINNVVQGESIVLSGNLLDKDTSTGIANREIKFTGSGVQSFTDKEAVTDSNGHFSLKGDAIEERGQELSLSVTAFFVDDSTYYGSSDVKIFPRPGEVPEIIINEVIDSSPRWEIDELVVSGIVTGNARGDTISLEWNSAGEIDKGVLIASDGSWKSSPYKYASADIGSNEIMARLVDEFGQTKATSDGFLVTVRSHSTAMVLDDIEKIEAGEPFILSGQLVDRDSNNAGIASKTLQISGSWEEPLINTQVTTDNRGLFALELISPHSDTNLGVSAFFAGDPLYLRSQAQGPVLLLPKISIQEVRPSNPEAARDTVYVTGTVVGEITDEMVILSWGDGQESPPIPLDGNTWEASHVYNDGGLRSITAKLTNDANEEVDAVTIGVNVGRFPIEILIGGGIVGGAAATILTLKNKIPWPKKEPDIDKSYQYPLRPPEIIFDYGIVPEGAKEIVVRKNEPEITYLNDVEKGKIAEEMNKILVQDLQQEGDLHRSISEAITKEVQNEENMRRIQSHFEELADARHAQRLDRKILVSKLSSEAIARMFDQFVNIYFTSQFVKAINYEVAVNDTGKLRPIYGIDLISIQPYIGAALLYAETGKKIPLFRVVFKITPEVKIGSAEFEKELDSGKNLKLKNIIFNLKPYISGFYLAPFNTIAEFSEANNLLKIQIILPSKSFQMDEISLRIG
jgi:hypothetical protein